jgi:hypothetical protein
VRISGFLALSGLMGALVATAMPLTADAQSQSITVEVHAARNAQTRPASPAGAVQSLRRGIPLPVIVAGLQAQSPYRDMSYIGVERYDPQSGVYALRFLNGRQVVVVVVDGRTGRILDRGY